MPMLYAINYDQNRWTPSGFGPSTTSLRHNFLFLCPRVGSMDIAVSWHVRISRSRSGPALQMPADRERGVQPPIRDDKNTDETPEGRTHDTYPPTTLNTGTILNHRTRCWKARDEWRNERLSCDDRIGFISYDCPVIRTTGIPVVSGKVCISWESSESIDIIIYFCHTRQTTTKILSCPAWENESPGL